MNNWTIKRRVSLAVHSIFAAIPFLAGTVASYVFWRGMLGNDWLGLVPVLVFEVLALTGLALTIGGIRSPFCGFKRILPIVSSAPLGYELWWLIAPRGTAWAWALTCIAVAALGYISWRCIAEITALFIDPARAAHERAEEQMQEARIAMHRARAVFTLRDELNALTVDVAGTLLAPAQVHYPAPALTQLQSVDALQQLARADVQCNDAMPTNADALHFSADAMQNNADALHCPKCNAPIAKGSA